MFVGMIPFPKHQNVVFFGTHSTRASCQGFGWRQLMYHGYAHLHLEYNLVDEFMIHSEYPL